MKKDKKQTIKEMTDAQLQTRLVDIAKELVDLRMKLNTGSLKNVRQMGQLRQEMAIIKTIQTERKLAANL